MEIPKARGRARSGWRCRCAPAALAAGVSLCCAGERAGPPPTAAVQPVVAATATTGDVPVILNTTGTVNSLATVTVKSRFSGYLTDIYFSEGQMVRKGDLLAQLDPRPYEAALGPYQRQLEKDQALLDSARLDLERRRRLQPQDDASVQAAADAAALVRQYERAVGNDHAQVDTQKLNLAYCRITSPVDGRVGLRQVDAGNYVTPADGIVVVTQLDPISVILLLPEDGLRPFVERQRAGTRQDVAIYDRTFAEKLGDGVLDGIDNAIDETTGTVKARARFDNADGALVPGLFVNVALLQDTLHGVVTVPGAALQRRVGTQEPAFVYVVNPDNRTVSERKVRTAAWASSGPVAVLSGLAAGERVVIGGAEGLKDGSSITVDGADTSQP